MTRAALLLTLIALPANAAVTQQLASSEFQYRYELDSTPNNQDLDANGTDDWWDVGIPTTLGGYATNTAPDQLYRGDFTSSIFRTVANSATADWTMEITVAKTGGTQGANGWLGIATDPAGENLSSAIYFKDDRVSIEAGATDLDFMTGTNFADGGYHTIRVAHDAAANSYYYWVNGTLLNGSLSSPIAPGNTNMNASGSIFIGDYSSSLAGTYSIDSIRVDSTGAYAPVPEPGAMMLGLLGVIALLRRGR